MLLDEQQALDRITIDVLRNAENALSDYVQQLEAKGASLYYGHSVIKRVRALIEVLESKPS